MRPGPGLSPAVPSGLTQPKARGRVFYGWWIVAASVVSLVFEAGAGYYSFGVFLAALTEDMGWSRAAVSVGISVWWLALAAASPLVGRLIDTQGIRRVMLAGASGFGLFMVLLGLTPSLFWLYVLYALLGISCSGISMVAVGTLTSRWFHRLRGRATGAAVSGIGLGGLLIVPLTGLLVSRFGWRVSYAVLGVLGWAVLLPVLSRVVRSSPEEMGLAPDGGPAASTAPAGGAAVEWQLRQAMATPSYWLILMAFFLGSMGLFGVLSHQVVYIRDMGLSLPLASLMFALTAGLGVVGKLFFGYLGDVIRPKFAAVFCFVAQAAGVVLLLNASSEASLWAFVAVFGVAMGGTVALYPLLLADGFGLASLGGLMGVVTAANAVAAGVGPLLAGFVYEMAGGYFGAFVAFIVAYLVAATAVLVAPRPHRAPATAYQNGR